MDMLFGDGPMLEGNWYNPKTGDSFTVRDTYFEDNQLYVLSTDGRRFNYDMISQYVKTKDPMPKTPIIQEQAKPSVPQSVLSEVLPVSSATDDLMTDEDKALLMGVSGELIGSQVSVQQPANIQPKPVITTQESEDNMLVRRILKRSAAPTVDCMVNWKAFPQKQMEMLDMMAVDVDAIVDYYINDIDLKQIREVIKKGILDYIDKQLTPREVKIVTPEEKTSKPNNNKPKEKKTNKK